MKRFLYFYLMRNRPDAIRQVVPFHVQYWHSRDLPDYMGGPFADRTGGLITFAATSVAATCSIDSPIAARSLLIASTIDLGVEWGKSRCRSLTWRWEVIKSERRDATE